ncbi:hypothetical protein J3R82DRAFT_10874 [Butyriboletus roseoflavus]|nr:hypothetical protein J3R82DRAFT_10874 [Butyriboletus roseoflavus]
MVISLWAKGIVNRFPPCLGATAIMNARVMSQDPTKFLELEKFKPERFLQENSHSVDKLSFAFGFGRRVVQVTRALAFSVCLGSGAADPVMA